MLSVHNSWAENIHGSYFDGVVNYYLTQINRPPARRAYGSERTEQEKLITKARNNENTKKSFAIKCKEITIKKLIEFGDISYKFLLNKYFNSHPDEISARKISSRLNKGNNDLTGQVGQADPHGRTQTVFYQMINRKDRRVRGGTKFLGRFRRLVGT